MTNYRKGTIYVGVTSDLKKRVWQHKNNAVDSFTARYGLKTLVYYEVTENMESAIQREKRLKHWNRSWKLNLIDSFNPSWRDLYIDLF
ncbi:GIY-YIG nuclease family protein [Bermanella marisrubri]|nr:GIY-YIG nuclease family protein [Bermanella marisrubri]